MQEPRDHDPKLMTKILSPNFSLRPRHPLSIIMMMMMVVVTNDDDDDKTKSQSRDALLLRESCTVYNKCW